MHLLFPLCAIRDKKAEEIWAKEQFLLKRNSRSKWLAYFMAMRAAVIDRWTEEKLCQNSGCTVLHIGCGLDSRIERVDAPFENWYDIDLPEVIAIRKKYYSENEKYRMLGASAAETDWVSALPKTENAVVVMEGICMYLSGNVICNLFAALEAHFDKVEIVADFYTSFGVKASKYKNPIKDVGAAAYFGMDDPKSAETEETKFNEELCMTPDELINELSGIEKAFFKKMFAGGFAKRLYKIYTYKKYNM